jgi:hypothetical protein
MTDRETLNALKAQLISNANRWFRWSMAATATLPMGAIVELIVPAASGLIIAIVILVVGVFLGGATVWAGRARFAAVLMVAEVLKPAPKVDRD